MCSREKVTRHLYYLQLKDNVLNYRHGCLEEKCFQVAAYALQADYGNFIAAEMEDYFDPREYFPAWVSIATTTANRELLLYSLSCF